MASSSLSFLILFSISLFYADASTILRMDLHHRFSDEVRRWSHSTSRHLPGGWPEKHSAEYYAALAAHSRGRFLSDEQEVTFYAGNTTVRISQLGFLHYGFVNLGTPNTTFMVALDTGSDLFWVPCECRSCAATKAGSNGFNFDFSVYSPKLSSTSQLVPCNSSCPYQDKCSDDRSVCPYSVQYVSANTSTAGFLVQDLLYLTTEDSNPEVVTVPIVFGCGRDQTGTFLDSAAPNGLFGLGMDKISVPSTLSSAGITSNSFSMCFGKDDIGRISFGDTGSSDQEETPLLKNSNSLYNISLTGISVANSSMNVSFNAIVDSGTSFTILADPVYKSLTKRFTAQVHDRQLTNTADAGLPFEFCYYLRPDVARAESLGLSFTTQGGSQFPIGHPYIYFSNAQNQTIYCLAVLESNRLNIIGENFLTGLRVVFDQERMILGWKNFNCYDVEESNPLPVNPRNISATPPSSAEGPSSKTPSVVVVPRSFTPDATKSNGSQNGSGAAVSTGAASGHLSLMSYFISTILVFLVLPLAII